jgi:hypothetical protein
MSNFNFSPVSKCFPQVSHLWEVTGYRKRISEDGTENRYISSRTSSFVVVAGK